jgi:hypothetical protein
MDGARGNSGGGGPAVFPNALPFEFDESWPVPNQVAADYRQVRECARVNMSALQRPPHHQCCRHSVQRSLKRCTASHNQR